MRIGEVVRQLGFSGLPQGAAGAERRGGRSANEPFPSPSVVFRYLTSCFVNPAEETSGQGTCFYSGSQ